MGGVLRGFPFLVRERGFPPLLEGLEARKVQRYKRGGGILPYKLAYIAVLFDVLYGLRVPKCLTQLPLLVLALVTRIVATLNRKSLVTAIASQENNCDSEHMCATLISRRFLREKLATSRLRLPIVAICDRDGVGHEVLAVLVDEHPRPPILSSSLSLELHGSLPILGVDSRRQRERSKSPKTCRKSSTKSPTISDDSDSFLIQLQEFLQSGGAMPEMSAAVGQKFLGNFEMRFLVVSFLHPQKRGG